MVAFKHSPWIAPIKTEMQGRPSIRSFATSFTYATYKDAYEEKSNWD